MQIDHKKSWAWGTTKQFRDSCMDFELLFPDGLTSIVAKTSAEDVGYHLHYMTRELHWMKWKISSKLALKYVKNFDGFH